MKMDQYSEPVSGFSDTVIFYAAHSALTVLSFVRRPSSVTEAQQNLQSAT